MSETVSVTVLGHSSTRLNSLEMALQEASDFDITRKLLMEGQVDPFEDLPSVTNVVVLDLADNWQDVLHAITSRSRGHRPPMILVGPDGNSDMMRLALKAGARDFHAHPINGGELVESVRQTGNERPDVDGSNQADIVVFASAKGGSGSTALACSMASALRDRDPEKRILILDLDFQYGNLPLYFDKGANPKLALALASNIRIDATVLDACTIKTEEDIDVLATYYDTVFSPWDVNSQAVGNLLNLLQSRYDHIIADMTRMIDPINFQAIERASRVCIVMQQNLAGLRYTRQFVGLLRDQGVPNDRLSVLVNRYDRSNVVRKQDIEDAFENHTVFTVPNDYKRMGYATDNAVSVIAKWRSAPVSKTLNNLTKRLWPEPVKARRGLFGRRKSG